MIDGFGLLNSNVPAAPEKVSGQRSPEVKSVGNKKEFASELNSTMSSPQGSDRAASEDKNVLSPVRSKMGLSSKAKNNNEAMEIFLKQMQSEFGISPEEVLEAFSSLSLEELASSPESSAKQVIAALNLEPNEANKALKMYNEMLAAAMIAGGAATLSKAAPEVNIHVMDPKEEQLLKLKGALDNMSDKFFNTGAYAPSKAVNTEEPALETAQSPKANVVLPEDAPSESANREGAPLSDLLPQESSSNLNRMANQSVDKQAVDQVLTQKEKSTATITSALPAENAPMLLPDNVASSAQAAAQPPASALPTVKTKTIQLQNIDDVVTEISDDGVAGLDNPGAEKTLNTNGITGMGATSGANSTQNQMNSSLEDSEKDKNGDRQIVESDLSRGLAKSGHKDLFILNGPKPTAADMQANVKEIISQAQFLASKGGGEMKISLNPEGMGEVKLRVKSVEGQINIEMVTSSSEAKKLLERGLNDLKDNLAAHKVNFDSIRIESGKEISHHMEQPHKDFDRNYQERFLGDFRERNNNSRREMVEFGAPFVPTSQTRDPAANMVYGSGARRNRSAYNGQSRRLDLVA